MLLLSAHLVIALFKVTVGFRSRAWVKVLNESTNAVSSADDVFEPETMYDHLNLDADTFLQQLVAGGYKSPNWMKRVTKWSPTEELLRLLADRVDSNNLAEMIAKIEQHVWEKLTPEKRLRYKTPLEVLHQRLEGLSQLIIDAESDRDFCPGLPCRRNSLVCSLPAESGGSLMSVGLGENDAERMYIETAPGKLVPKTFSNRQQQILEGRSANGAVSLSRNVVNQLGHVTLHIHDIVAQTGALKFTVYPKIGLAVLDYIERTRCSESGGALLGWLVERLREFRMEKVQLKDDSHVTCTMPDGTHGPSAPLRILSMLDSDSPLEGRSYYEKHDFRATNQNYAASKAALNMPAVGLMALLNCVHPRTIEQQRALKALQSKKPSSDETIFHWLQTQNALGRRVLPNHISACVRAAFVAKLFEGSLMELGAPTKLPGWGTPRACSQDDINLGESTWNQFGALVKVFGAHWSLMKFERHL